MRWFEFPALLQPHVRIQKVCLSPGWRKFSCHPRINLYKSHWFSTPLLLRSWQTAKRALDPLLGMRAVKIKGGDSRPEQLLLLKWFFFWSLWAFLSPQLQSSRRGITHLPWMPLAVHCLIFCWLITSSGNTPAVADSFDLKILFPAFCSSKIQRWSNSSFHLFFPPFR